MTTPGLTPFRIGGREFDFAARTYIMGILNVTPDSFSDGGRYLSTDAAVARGLRMIDEGADIIDIGGESTRPKGTVYGEGAEPVGPEEELRRVLPVIRQLVKRTDIPLSIDTMKSVVAQEALAAGAVIVNDVSGFRCDAALPSIVADAGAAAVVMHSRGTPKTMQAEPVYADLFGEVMDALRIAVRAGEAAGVRQMFVDPGIGFGKTLRHNLELLAHLDRLHEIGRPILVGPSRKSFLGAVLNLPVDERLEGSLAAVSACVLNGANVVRVHDVRETKRAVAVADAIRRAGEGAMSDNLTSDR
ncbi:MAG TPA: dihydropteroate synthase [Bacteroidota bacterium]|nr:dihydropteroate synthase [Bacteroidota bacterium]